MAGYVVHGRGHDAEWLLQNERAHNDRMVQQARSGRRPSARRQVGDIGAVAPVTEAESRDAACFVRRRVNGEVVDEVLAMLGLEAS